MTKLGKQILGIKKWLFDLRRDIHRHPELSYQEERTAGIVADRLGKLGLEVRTRVGRTGVVGLWRAARPGPCLALRADMDALPIVEEVNREWKSVNRGVMHACGHDLHVAMLLGAARILAEDSQYRQRLSGAVKFIFQPAEEGPGGAGAMIADGVLADPPVTAIFAGHVLPVLATGHVGITRGVAMAGVTNFRIVIKGKGGHAAHPNLAVDPIAPAAELVMDIKAKAADLKQALVAVCTFQAGTKTNIIPEAAQLSGTIRSLDRLAGKKARGLIKESAANLGKARGVTATIRFEPGYPVLVNHEAMVDLMVEVAEQVLGPQGVIDQGPSYGTEDMAYFLQKVPGAHYWLGCGRPSTDRAPMLHSAEFDPDEEAMPIGVEIMVRLAERYLACPIEAD